MLRYETIEPDTLALLKQLMSASELKDYVLVGGTALSLQIGHRKSVDLDMFCYGDFNPDSIIDKMYEKFGYRIRAISDTIIVGNIGDIKVDFVRAKNHLVQPVIIEDGIRVADKRDIAAMKIWAIVRSGTRMKDYVDVACMSTLMPLSDMLKVYSEAYNTDSEMFAMKRLLQYGSIENFESIKMIGYQMNWDQIKNRIADMVREPDKIFDNYPLECSVGHKEKVAAGCGKDWCLIRQKTKTFFEKLILSSENKKKGK